MGVIKREWQAALVYLLILVLVVNVHFLGLVDFSYYGINLSGYSLFAYIAYSIVLAFSRDPFVRQHLNASLGVFFVYLFLSSLYSGMMFALGYQVSLISLSLLQGANFATWIAITPLLAILAHAMLSAVYGMVVSLKGLDPNGKPLTV